MKLPRPLLIVVVVILVMALIGCGLAAARLGEQDDSEAQRKNELRTGALPELLAGLSPRSPPIALTAGDVTGSCSLATSALQVSGLCSIEVGSADAPRRQLLLRPQSGSMLMFVAVTHDGETNSDSLVVGSNSDEGSVVLTAGDSADITLNCTCTVLVNP